MIDYPAKVLVVDDQPANIQVLSQVLKDEYDIHVATSGQKAIDLCRAKQPDLVLLDIMMPDLDGYHVCRVLKSEQSTRDIPIIFVTARGEVQDETRGLEAGAVDFITKPISPPIVKARVRNHIQLKRQTDALRRLSLMDGLTAIANRRHFDESLDKCWRRCARAGAPLSLIMIDVDHFKAYNDHYGHTGGDDCLRALAALLARQMNRVDDLAARFGGEEFACLLPETDEAGAHEVGLRILAALEAAALPHAASPVAPHVTVSLGAATVLPGAGPGKEALLRTADGLLYQAKAEGRNGLRAGVVG